MVALRLDILQLSFQGFGGRALGRHVALSGSHAGGRARQLSLQRIGRLLLAKLPLRQRRRQPLNFRPAAQSTNLCTNPLTKTSMDIRMASRSVASGKSTQGNSSFKQARAAAWWQEHCPPGSLALVCCCCIHYQEISSEFPSLPDTRWSGKRKHVGVERRLRTCRTRHWCAFAP